MQIEEKDLKGKVMLILDWRILALLIVIFVGSVLMAGFWYKEARVLLAEFRGYQELVEIYRARVAIYDRFLGLVEETEEEWERRNRGQGERE